MGDGDHLGQAEAGVPVNIYMDVGGSLVGEIKEDRNLRRAVCIQVISSYEAE